MRRKTGQDRTGQDRTKLVFTRKATHLHSTIGPLRDRELLCSTLLCTVQSRDEGQTDEGTFTYRRPASFLPLSSSLPILVLLLPSPSPAAPECLCLELCCAQHVHYHNSSSRPPRPPLLPLPRVAPLPHEPLRS